MEGFKVQQMGRSLRGFHKIEEKKQIFYSFIHSFIHQWLYNPLLGPDLFFSFVIFNTRTVGHPGRVISPLKGRYLHTE
jgi:hypothetical protein